MISHLKSVDNASREAADAITQRLTDHLISSGWPESAAKSVAVVRTTSGFNVEYDGAAKDQAMSLEYGTERQRPTSAVRKFLNNEALLNEIYFSHLEKHLGEIL
jgi:hypothetical protein